jgi:Phasin protein
MLQRTILLDLSRNKRHTEFKSLAATHHIERSKGTTTMIMKPEDMQKLGQTNMDNTMKMFGDMTKNFQAIATEMTDYSKKSFEDGTQTMEKLMGVKSIEQAVEIQTTFAKRAYDNYMAQMTRVGTMYTDLAKEAVKPMASAFQVQQAGR